MWVSVNIAYCRNSTFTINSAPESKAGHDHGKILSMDKPELDGAAPKHSNIDLPERLLGHSKIGHKAYV